MRQGYCRVFGAVTVMAAACAAAAQGGFGGWGNCIDVNNTMPFSADAGWETWGNSVMMASLGTSGTVTYGGAVSTTDPNPPCFIPAITGNARGRWAFSAGANGSVQSMFDDGMPFSFGYPYPAATWGYATLTVDSTTLNGQPASTRTLFGSGGFATAFTGASDRYFFAEEGIGMTTVDVRCDLIGDAARIQWTLTNTDTAASHTIGLWFGLWTAMYSGTSGSTSGFGLGQDAPYGSSSDKPNYVFIPGLIPPTTEQRYIRSVDTSSFPAFVDFCFGQSNAYGVRVECGPTADTEDSTGLNSDCTSCDEFALGQAFFLLGAPKAGDLTFPDVMFGPGNTGGDVTYIDAPGFIQKFYEQSVPSGAARTIVQYFHSTWGATNYFKPYSVVVDAPQVIATDLSTTTGLAAWPQNTDPGIPTTNGAYLIRVYVDDTRGFSTADRSIELDNVNVTIKLPPGLNLASGETATKVIPKVLPGGGPNTPLSSVDFQVIPDGITNGPVTYSVTVSPTPGPTKTITGSIMISATPKLTLSQGPNLVGTPWTFTDNSWEAILGLVQGTDFVAYAWDPIQNGYIVSPSASRGIGNWIVATNNIGIRSLQSNPQPPSDTTVGSPLINLQPGWNLVSNPYAYPVEISQLIGATNANSQQDFVWSELVAQGFVNGAVGYYSPSSGSYNYLQNGTDILLPNVGYWIFVGIQQPLTLKYPPVFEEYVPGSDRSQTPVWTQTENQWRLQLSVRTSKSVDDQNYVGVTSTPKLVQALQIMKPPTMPAKVAGVSLAFNGSVNGKATRMAQILSTTAAQKQYTMTVTTPQAGDVTLTWPNITTIPKTIQVRLVDTASGANRLMNQSSGYTFTAQAGATRTFLVQLQSRTPGRATIGSVIATHTTRAPGSPVAINYTLGVAATTSVEIVNAAGTPVYTITSGRADSAGTNSVIWNLRDNANRNVAPGTYTVIIVASTPDGSTARKRVPVNVTR